MVIKVKRVIKLSEIHEMLNDLLVNLFNDIMKIEEKALTAGEYKDISINDMHIIEIIGRDSARNMTSVAKDIGVTVGTLTIAINSLVKKDYVKRARSSKDKRVVLISLSEKGQKAYAHHMSFHQKMIEEIKKNVNEDQVNILIDTLKAIKRYFEGQA